MTNLQAIGLTAAGGSVGGLICVLLFGIAVRQGNANIAPRCTARPKETIYARKPKHKCQQRGNPFLGWVWWTLKLSYDTMLRGVPGTGTRKNGMAGKMLDVNLDGIVLLRFHGLCLRVALVTSILALGVVLPINLTAQCYSSNKLDPTCTDPDNENEKLSDYDRTTLANIPPLTSTGNLGRAGDEPDASVFATFREAVWGGGYYSGLLLRMYGIVICSWLVFWFACHSMFKEWKELLALRRVYYLENDIWNRRRDELNKTVYALPDDDSSCSSFSSDEDDSSSLDNFEENAENAENGHIESNSTKGSGSISAAGLKKRRKVGNSRSKSKGEKNRKKKGKKGKRRQKEERGNLRSRRDPWIPHPEQRETVPNIELYSVLVGELPCLPSEVVSESDIESVAIGFSRSQAIDWQLAVVSTFFNHCVPNQPGFSSSVAAVTILPDAPALARAWRRWYTAAAALRRLRFIRTLINDMRHYDITEEDDAEESEEDLTNIVEVGTRDCDLSALSTTPRVDPSKVPDPPSKQGGHTRQLTSTTADWWNRNQGSSPLQQFMKTTAAAADIGNEEGYVHGLKQSRTVSPFLNSEQAVVDSHAPIDNLPVDTSPSKVDPPPFIVAANPSYMSTAGAAGPVDPSERAKQALTYYRSVFGADDNLDVESHFFQALNFGPEQTAVYSRELAQGAANCCPNGCGEGRLRNNMRIDELIQLEREAVVRVHNANKSLQYAQARAAVSVLDANGGSAKTLKQADSEEEGNPGKPGKPKKSKSLGHSLEGDGSVDVSPSKKKKVHRRVQSWSPMKHTVPAKITTSDRSQSGQSHHSRMWTTSGEFVLPESLEMEAQLLVKQCISTKNSLPSLAEVNAPTGNGNNRFQTVPGKRLAHSHTVMDGTVAFTPSLAPPPGSTLVPPLPPKILRNAPPAPPPPPPVPPFGLSVPKEASQAPIPRPQMLGRRTQSVGWDMGSNVASIAEDKSLPDGAIPQARGSLRPPTIGVAQTTNNTSSTATYISAFNQTYQGKHLGHHQAEGSAGPNEMGRKMGSSGGKTSNPLKKATKAIPTFDSVDYFQQLNRNRARMMRSESISSCRSFSSQNSGHTNQSRWGAIALDSEGKLAVRRPSQRALLRNTETSSQTDKLEKLRSFRWDEAPLGCSSISLDIGLQRPSSPNEAFNSSSGMLTAIDDFDQEDLLSVSLDPVKPLDDNHNLPVDDSNDTSKVDVTAESEFVSKSDLGVTRRRDRKETNAAAGDTASYDLIGLEPSNQWRQVERICNSSPFDRNFGNGAPRPDSQSQRSVSSSSYFDDGVWTMPDVRRAVRKDSHKLWRAVRNFFQRLGGFFVRTHKVVDELKSNSTFAVVTFTNRQAAVAARHLLADGRGANRWVAVDRHPVPPLADSASFDLVTCRGCCRPVTLSINKSQQMIRKFFAYSLLAFMYVFYTVPITFASSLVKPEKLYEVFPSFGELAASNPLFSEILSGIVPASLLALFFALCPVIFKAIANSGSNATSVVDAESAALTYYWWFMVFTAFSGSSLATMALSAIGEGSVSLAQLLVNIALTIPTQVSGAWINWIIFRMTLILPNQYMLQLNTFLFGFLGMNCCKRAVMGGGPGGCIPYRIYVDSGVVFMCNVALSFASPLVAPIALFYFLVCAPLWRRNCLYIYRPKYDGGGLRWPFLFDVCVSSMVVGQILLTTMMAIKQAIGPAIMAAAAIPPTLLFRTMCRKRFFRAYEDAGLLQTSLLDSWDSTVPTSMKEREEFRKFLVDAHKAAYIPVCIAGDATSVLTAEPALVVPLDYDEPEDEEFVNGTPVNSVP